MMGELQPFIRIALYIAAGYLANAGLPAELVQLVSTDPSIADLMGQAAAGLIAVLTMAWWRIAKRMGWRT
jgi:hypothetical protein